MTFQAYLDAVKTKTGLSPEDFRALTADKGLLEPGTKAGQVVAWLKADFGLGHGHAMAVYATIKSAVQPPMRASLVVDALSMAHERGLTAGNAIMHTDRGSQYFAKSCQRRLDRLAIRQSASRTGSCLHGAACGAR